MSLRTQRALATASVVGSYSVVSPENIFRGTKQDLPRDFHQARNVFRAETKALENFERRTGGPRVSIQPKISGGKKCSPTVRPQAHGSATMVIPGIHVPQDFGTEYLVPYNVDNEAFKALTGANLLMWFETTAEGKASKESLEAVKLQAAYAKHNLLVAAASGTDEELQKATEACAVQDAAVKVIEANHFDKAHSKHSLAKEKIAANEANTAKVIKAIKAKSVAGVNDSQGNVSIPSELIKPGEHLKARQTPKALRSITTDKNGKVTGSPSAERIRDAAGNLVLAESVENTAEENADNKNAATQHKFQKTGVSKLVAIEAREEKIDFLSSEVSRLENEKAEHGLGWKQEKDLVRLTAELKATKTRLAGDLDPIRDQVRVKGVKVITNNASGKKAGTQTCSKHNGSLNCKCHREVLLDASRGISKRSKS